MTPAKVALVHPPHQPPPVATAVAVLLVYPLSLLVLNSNVLYTSPTSSPSSVCNTSSPLLSIHVLFPHEVSKCSQLGLVLTCYKEDDAPCFHQNLCFSPHTFDVLVSLIQDSLRFQNDSQNEQMLVPSQLAIALFHFSHFGSAASVDAIAQWAGCSAGAVINSTCRVIKAFLLLHDQAI